MPRISVIIPAFNNGPYIEEAIRSVLAQSRPVDEIIVIDDGSQDGTENIVRAITDPRIQYHRQENSGVSAARNNGLERTTGDYIAFLDADDIWRPTMVEQQLALISSDPTLVCCFANFVRFVNDTGERLGHQFTFFPELASLKTCPLPGGVGRIIEGNAFDALIRFGEFPAFMLTMIFRADFIRDLRFNSKLVRCQDADFVLRAYLRGRVAYADGIVADVRRHGKNATHDVAMMTVDKLLALESVRQDPLAVPHFQVLEQRIARARFDAAGSLLKRSRYREARTVWLRALRSRTSAVRKIKGSIRLAILLLTSTSRKKQPRGTHGRD